MLGLDVIEVMTPSGHPSIINKILKIILYLSLKPVHRFSSYPLFKIDYSTYMKSKTKQVNFLVCSLLLKSQLLTFLFLSLYNFKFYWNCKKIQAWLLVKNDFTILYIPLNLKR